MSFNNAVNANQTGIQTLSSAGAWTGSTVTQYGVLVGGATNAVGSTAVGSAGQVLQSSGAGVNPAYSTATYPTTATGTGTILRADGTNWVASTSTYPNTNAINTLLYASSANVMAALATANNGVLITSNTGVPSILAESATAGIPLVSGGTGVPPAFTTAVVAGGGTGVTSTTAYAVLTGGTTSTGALQSIASVGTSGQVLTSNGAGALPSFQAVSAAGAFSSINVQTFVANGTYTPTANMKYCVIECVGGGGGGGGTASQTTTGWGGGGGGGAYSRKFASAATIGASQTVTIGGGGGGGSAGTNNGTAGGATSLGTICTANGGSAGTGNTNGGQVAGGAGGTAGTGDFSIPGGRGLSGTSLGATSGNIGGLGGNSVMGFGGIPATAATNPATGGAATNYGGGGQGGYSAAAAGTAAGGAGSGGIVIVTEYI